MAWYWWVLIVLAVAIIGYFKLKILKKMIAKKKDKAEAKEDF